MMARVLGRAPSTVSREHIRNTVGGPYRACGRTPSRRPEPVSHGDPAHSWIPGCGRMCGRSWPRAARLSRLPDVSDARILTTRGTPLGRNHLCGTVCAAPWHAAERTAGRVALGAHGAPASVARYRPTRPDSPHDADGRAPHRGGPPHRAGPLGGRLDQGVRNGSAVGTLVERTTRLVILARMDGTDARSAREGFTKKLRPVPALLCKLLTYDRGNERAEHVRLTERLNIRVFFADPYSPWQRGTNEHTNELLRQYLPKGTDLSGYTQRELNAIAHRVNPRPRKCLNFAMPLEVYAPLRHHSPVARGT